MRPHILCRHETNYTIFYKVSYIIRLEKGLVKRQWPVKLYNEHPRIRRGGFMIRLRIAIWYTVLLDPCISFIVS